MKTFKLLSISWLLISILAACSQTPGSAAPTNITDKNPDELNSMTLQAYTKQAQTATAFPAMVPITASTVISNGTLQPTTTVIPPNTPVWSAYNYTCIPAKNGSTMTMNLAWSDRSDNETGYIVYRDRQALLTLPVNSTRYVDVAFVASGQMLSYSVEALNSAGPASTSTITAGCQ